MKTTFKIIVIGFLSGLAGSYAGYQYWVYPAAVQPVPMADFQSVNFTNAEDVALPVPTDAALPPAVSEDFSDAASRSTASVVYINSISQVSNHEVAARNQITRRAKNPRPSVEECTSEDNAHKKIAEVDAEPT